MRTRSSTANVSGADSAQDIVWATSDLPDGAPTSVGLNLWHSSASELLPDDSC